MAAEHDAGRRVRTRRVPQRPQPVERAGLGELRAAEPGHEVAAADAARVLEALSTG